MGLDTSHDCWHGAYSAFHRWRCEIARAAGLPPLELMEGFYCRLLAEGEWPNGGVPTLWPGPAKGDHRVWPLARIDKLLPISWACLKPSPLHILLNHSDCEGEIAAADCTPIADALEALLANLPDEEGGGHIGNWRDTTKRFITGLRLAAQKNENVEFH